MTHTVDTLMALAERMAVAMDGNPDACELIDARSELRAALTEALAKDVSLIDEGNKAQLLIPPDSRELEQAAQPVRGPSPGACKTCGNEYLASRTDVYKDKRPFIYCDCCGAMADSKTWYLTHGIGGDK